jgi:hypothetical protein
MHSKFDRKKAVTYKTSSCEIVFVTKMKILCNLG